ncbi:MAG: alpha/beta fold hydrolase [Deltaproteobacteria bacterium]|nr:alpha/beta fold hydrolase [Deltaproteobacteria bacterium]
MNRLVLFHGWGTTGRIWQRQTDAWGAVMEVLAPDIPAWDPAWVKNYLAGMSLKDCVLVGWSLGGMLLLEALADQKPAPGAVILVAAAASFCRRPDHPWGQPAAAVRAMRQGLLQDPRGVVREFALNSLAPDEMVFREEVIRHFDTPASPEHLAAGLDYLLRQDCREKLGEIQAPVIIAQGEADAIVPPAQARFLHERLAGSRFHLFLDTGHLPFLTQTARFNEVLEDILREGTGPEDNFS